MIRGTGIDIVEVDRIRDSIDGNERFKSQAFSPAEVQYCEKQGNPYQSYAAHFAAKEAFFKALGAGWRGKLAFHEVVIMNDQWGKPVLQLSGESQQRLQALGNTRVHLSISHTKAYATAMVIIENID